ncbi:MAG: prolyl oligopeptidase family serine peptidase [Pontiella sp.]|nr:prolyl oligopeptidase family serine peptidase [Pontiella sp.]
MSKTQSRFTGISKCVLSMTVLFGLVGSLRAAKAPQWAIDLYEAHTYEEMDYRLLRPLDFDAKKRYPVILSLHGGSGRSNKNIRNLRKWNTQLADGRLQDYPCYVLAPQTPKGWTPAELTKCKAIISGLPSVDLNRIYIMGHSMGGAGTYKFIQADPDYFAAAVSSAGRGIKASNIKDGLNLWIFHGENDGTISIDHSHTLFAEMQAAGKPMKFTMIHKFAHGSSHAILEKEVGASGHESGYDAEWKRLVSFETKSSTGDTDPEPNVLKWMFSKSLDGSAVKGK